MFILPELDFYNKAFNEITYSNRRYLNIVFNNKNSFIINKKIIDAIESNISPENIDYFHSFLKEISDNNRYELCAIEIDNYKKNCLDYYTGSNKQFLIPIKSSIESEFTKHEFWNLLDMNSDEEYDTLLKEILMTGIINFSYQDFESDDEIEKFIDNIFCIPKYINEVHCFNRDLDTRFIEKLKDARINYYTLIKNPIPQNIHEYRQFKNDYHKHISKKFKLFTVSKKTLIHERKIFIDNLCINFDNAFENISIKEPTWEVYIIYDKSKFEKWKTKTNQFYLVN